MATDTKEQILDSAEKLFAERGIDAVSLRMITTDAGANLAAVNYHFGSKETLVKEAFARHIKVINRERIEMLNDAEARAGEGPLALEDVLRALITPAIRMSQHDDRGRAFTKLCGRIHAELADCVQAVYDELFEEVVRRFTVAFEHALPHLPEKDRAWRGHFVVGAMVHVMMEGDRLTKYSGGVCDPSRVEEVIEQMVRFGAAGMRAPSLQDTAENNEDARIETPQEEVA